MNATETEMRRIQCSGNSTFLITLPKRWVQRLDLTNGDNMTIVPVSDRTLIIRPVRSDGGLLLEEPPFVIRMHNRDPEDLQRTFTGAYLAGHNVFRFESEPNDRGARETVRAILETVTGLEIVDEDPEKMVVRDLTATRHFSFEQGIRRMHLIVRAMMKEVPENDSCPDPRVQDLEERYADIKRFNLMINKQFTRLSLSEGSDDTPSQTAYGYVFVSRYLERISRHSLRVGTYWSRLGPERKRMSRSNLALSKLLDQVMEAFNRKDFNLANDLVERCLSQEKQILAIRNDIMDKEMDPQGAMASAFVIDSLDRIRSYIQDIAETSINHLYIDEFRRAGKREGA